MKISLASDHAGFVLKEWLCSFLKKKGIIVHDNGTSKSENVDYSDYVPFVVNDILFEKYDLGILVCSSGTGMNIMANRYANIRSTVCYDVERIIAARKHNDVNVLCIGADYITPKRAERMVNAFINTSFSQEERHIRRLNKFNDLGEKDKRDVF